MPGVTTAYQAGIHSDRPAANSGCILYACSTHGKAYRSDGSTWTDWLVISAGMTNPMTTTGDIIYSSSGSTPGRLAVGGANAVLHGGASIPAYSAVVPADLDVSTDNTTADATTGHHGLLPKLGGGTTNFLRADGTWNAPAGGGGGAAAYDSWVDRANTTTAHGLATISGCTREAASGGSFGNGPAGQAFLHLTSSPGGSFSTFVALASLTPGSLVRATFAAQTFEGGGVQIQAVTQISTIFSHRYITSGGAASSVYYDLAGSSGVFPVHTVASLVGNDGAWVLQSNYKVGVGAMVLEVITP